MKTKDIKKGISLIVLIITIIVVIILAAVVILTLSKNNPIESAKEARFKYDVRTFQDELALTVSKQYTTAGGHRDEKITTSDFDEIKEYIPSFSEKYKDRFIIQDDELVYTKQLDDIEKEYSQSLNVKEKQKLLPDEYQQVEYIESTGTQYIDTEIEIDNGYTINTNILFTDFLNNYIITGTYGMELGGINDNARYFVRIDKNTGDLHYQYGSSTKYGESILQLNTKYNIECKLTNSSQYLKLDNYLISSTSISVYQPKTSLIFLGNMDNNRDGISIRNICHAKVYNCKYYDSNDKLIRYFIPCKSTTNVTNADGNQVPANTNGLYDLVEGKFYTNKGDKTKGDFKCGPEVQ